MKKRQVVLYIFVMLMLLATSVYATINSDLSLRFISDSVLHPGDEFQVVIGLENLQTSDGIKAIEGYINIDENILEDLTISSVKTNENGKVKINNNELSVYDVSKISSNVETGILLNTKPVSGKGDYKIVINLAETISSDTELLTINFKIKDNAEVGEYHDAIVYTLFNVFSNNAQEKKELASKSIRLSINEKNTAPVSNNVVDNNVNNQINNNVENKTNNTINNKIDNTVDNKVDNAVNNKIDNKVNNKVDNKVSNNTQNKINNNNVINNKNSNSQNGVKATTNNVNNKSDNTTSPTKLPKTGYRLILFPIVAIAIVGVVFYKKYTKYDNYHE